MKNDIVSVLEFATPTSLIFSDSLTTGSNELNGPIPTELAMLTKLSNLDLRANELTGPIPSELVGLGDSLEQLSLENNQLTGSILPELFEFFPNLQRLWLGHNLLSGTIPSTVQGFMGISLHAASNFLTGTIPQELFYVSRLTSLVLDGNDVSGPIMNPHCLWHQN